MMSWRTAKVALVAFIAAVAMAITGVIAGPPAPAQAANSADFNPGNIMSDAVFFNGNAMSAPEIQAFLNARVPRCTLGDAGRPAGGIYTFPSGSQTVLAWNCLKDFRATVPSLAGDAICAPIQGGNISAAEMIHRVGLACNVSQKALIVLLEKEQSLITDTFPAQIQMDRATGFNCPDTAPCSAASAGFFKQVYSAARQFQVYGTGQFRWYPVGAVSNIRFHPNAACGSTPVVIQNRATAALYYYTPYQPNAAAMRNLYGTGDACSAYGNRNFWRMYTDWFGSTIEIPGSRQFVVAAYQDVLGRAPESDAVMNFWISRIASGMSRADMANAFNNSDEYRYMKIVEAYDRALKRAPDPAGAEYWMGVLRRGELSPENLYSTFISMDEMFLVQGGGTNQGYITALYRELLLREPDQGGLSFWSARLDRGENRRAISDSIWFSPEKYNVRVTEAYQKFLGRTANAGEQEYWSNVARAFGPTVMRSMIMSSDEYWVKADVRY